MSNNGETIIMIQLKINSFDNTLTNVEKFSIIRKILINFA